MAFFYSMHEEGREGMAILVLLKLTACVNDHGVGFALDSVLVVES